MTPAWLFLLVANAPVWMIFLDHHRNGGWQRGLGFVVLVYGSIWFLAMLPQGALMHLALASPLLVLAYVTGMFLQAGRRRGK